MLKFDFKRYIKIINAILGIIIAANFIYLTIVFIKELKGKKSITATYQKNSEIDTLMSELEKNSDKLKNILK